MSMWKGFGRALRLIERYTVDATKPYGLRDDVSSLRKEKSILETKNGTYLINGKLIQRKNILKGERGLGKVRH